MLVNFSNHPSRYWDDKQRNTSLRFGEIVDMPFPQIAPDASIEELQKFAETYVQRILSLAGTETVTVHIMGEMTFTFMMVSRLKELGIVCLASTTERKTSYREDGSKLSEFSFVKFREY